MTDMRRRRILVVEDDEAMAELLKGRLESVGFEVHTEGTGAAALRYAMEQRPDLVMLDVKLPDISGYQVSQELRKRCSAWESAIVMLTAMAQPIDQLRGFAYGADAYLTKPFDSDELLQTVSQLLA